MLHNETLQEEFSIFLSTVPPQRLKQNMLRVFLSYLKNEHKEGLPVFMDDFLTDLIAFFDLLDAIEEGRS